MATAAVAIATAATTTTAAAAATTTSGNTGSTTSAASASVTTAALVFAAARANATTSTQTTTKGGLPMRLHQQQQLRPSSSSSSSSSQQHQNDHDCCFACQSTTPFYVDHGQGDCVCTSCGVVNESRLLVQAPEWHDFNDVEDLVKNKASMARSSLVPTDDTKYLGGLQPTTLSRRVYGGPQMRMHREMVASSSSKTNGRSNNNNNSGSSRSGGHRSTTQRLLRTNRKMNMMMERIHKRALETARLRHRVRQKKNKIRKQHNDATDAATDTADDDTDTIDYDDEDDTTVNTSSTYQLPHLGYDEMLLKEDREVEEELARITSALNARKWSLARAIRDHGQPHELQQYSDDVDDSNNVGDNDGDDVVPMTLIQKQQQARAAHDLYTAWSMLTTASLRLQLSDRVQQDAVAKLCQYARQRDGIVVRGVASTLKKKNTHQNANTQEQQEQERAAKAALQQYNRQKQAGALCAALLFTAARRLGCPRTMIEICQSVQRPSSATQPQDCGEQQQQVLDLSGEENQLFIKKKHCSKAMNELKETFPELVMQPPPPAPGTSGSSSNNRQQQHQISATPRNTLSSDSIVNFTEHAVRKLRLPPVAEAAVLSLVVSLLLDPSTATAAKRSPQETTAAIMTTKSSMLCVGATTYFIGVAGEIMQKLARQAVKQQHQKKKRSSVAAAASKKRIKIEPGTDPRNSNTTADDDDDLGAASPLSVIKAVVDETNHTDVNYKDLMLPPPPTQDDNDADAAVGAEIDTMIQERKEYEMRRMWDTWCQQTSWFRPLPAIEQACCSGVSQSKILDYYRNQLFPRRAQLLQSLKDAVTPDAVVDTAASSGDSKKKTLGEPKKTLLLMDTPMASVLLPHIVVAAPLMKADGGK